MNKERLALLCHEAQHQLYQHMLKQLEARKKATLWYRVKEWLRKPFQKGDKT